MGRNSREKNGLEPLIATAVRVEKSVKEKCKELHGSLAKALRFAANNPPKQKEND